MMVMRRRPGEAVLIGESIEIVVCEAGETIRIGADIEVQITHSGSNRAKIAIRAPREILVIPREAMMAREENLAAASIQPHELSNFLKRRSESQPSMAQE